MVDVDWMMKAMMGDQLIVRLHITPGIAPKAVAWAFSYWNDDMAYNGFRVRYSYDAAYNRGVLPIKARALPSDPNRWTGFFIRQARRWPKPWHLSEMTVCTIGTIRDNTRHIPTTDPQAMAHLARFQGAVSETDPSKCKGWSVSWGISLDITARRLDGIVNSAVKDWRRLIDQY